MGLTVNKWHYFGLTTWTTTKLGLSEWLLHKVRDDVDIAGYHYPTEYRFNSVGTASRTLSRAGFTSVEFRMWDLPKLYTPYLPSPLIGLAPAWHRAVYRLGQPRLMGILTFKATPLTWPAHSPPSADMGRWGSDFFGYLGAPCGGDRSVRQVPGERE